jgi:L-histidine N-alpha-methyltransferase
MPAVSRTFAEDVLAGLTAIRKSIPPRWFYDELGSALFDAITHLPEYYVTRAETEVLTGYRSEIATAIGTVGRVVELGSGTARKSRLILEAISQPRLEYVPIDVDMSVLEKTARELLLEQPAVKVTAISGDFRRAARYLRDLPSPSGRTCVLFLGSTVGNLELSDAATLLRDLRAVLQSGDTVLLGADLKKPQPIIDAAYNDALGVTASFNLNLLQRMNRELGAHFDLRSFAHRAEYIERLGRVEMHLVSLRPQTVSIDKLRLEATFVEGETIHTENSYKYDEPTLDRLATEGGFEVTQRWSDSRGWFADVLMTV